MPAAPGDTSGFPDPLAWKVVSTSGDVGVVQGAPPKLVKVRAGAFIMPGTRVESGKSGWVVLIHAKDVMAVAAKTKLSLPDKAPDSKTTRILQSLGSILSKIDKLPGRRFEVQTPFLIAGVKGTTFNDNVGATGASVSVSDGTVGVSGGAGGTGGPSDVTPGQTASVAAASGGRVLVGATGPSAKSGSGKGKGKGPGAKGSGKGAGPGKGSGKANKTNTRSGGASGGRGKSASAGGNGKGGGNSNAGGNGGGKGKGK